jgi:hypothetical protein
LTRQKGKKRKMMEGSLIWLLTVTVPTIIAVPGCSETPLTTSWPIGKDTDSTFLDAVKSQHLQKHGSRAKLRPETTKGMTAFTGSLPTLEL